MSNIFQEDVANVISNVSHESWEKLRNAHIFMTGGTGYFGTWMLKSFLAANDQYDLNAKITILSRNPSKLFEKHPELSTRLAVALISGDVCDFEFPSEKFTHILHFAVEYTSPERMLNGIVRGTQRLLDFAKTSSAKEFLFASSGAVYGALPSDLAFVPESYLGAPDTNDPRSAYGEGKRVAELVLSIASSEWGLNAKIARCFAQVGPYMPLDGSFAAGNFIRDALSGGPIKIQGDGTPIRSYIYGSDLATWLWTILFNGRSCQPYNVGGSEPISISELAQMVCESFGGDIKINIQRQVEGTSVRNQYVPDISRAQTELKISPLTSLDEAVKRAVKWYLSK